MAMTSDAKRALSSTIRGLRQRLLDDLRIAAESAYRLSVRAQDAGLDEAAHILRKRLDSWLDEQVRAQPAGGRRRERAAFLREAEQQAAYTLLNRLVILRLMEEPGPSDQPLRKPALIKGGWNLADRHIHKIRCNRMGLSSWGGWGTVRVWGCHTNPNLSGFPRPAPR